MINTVRIEEGKYMIGNHQAFPIYAFELSWKETVSGLSVTNGTYFIKMYKEEQTEEQLAEVLNTTLEEFKKTRSLNEMVTSSKLLMYETWCLHWFNHHTFDIGQTDSEAINSFEQYVQRHAYYQQDGTSFRLPGRVCLMGAEERHRWCSVNEHGEHDYDKIPCRCKDCKERGLLQINH